MQHGVITLSPPQGLKDTNEQPWCSTPQSRKLLSERGCINIQIRLIVVHEIDYFRNGETLYGSREREPYTHFFYLDDHIVKPLLMIF